MFDPLDAILGLTPDPTLVPRPHPASLEDDALLRHCTVGKGRSGGPGGQHRNKVETTVFITHVPTRIESHAGERRSVVDNRREAIFRLRLRLAVGVRSIVPAGDARSDLWRTRVSKGKISCSPQHRDYPSMLAEAMDLLAACGWNEKTAAARLECTPTQLVGLVRAHAPALVRVNDERAKKKLHALR
jgi:hypothetical protein